MFIHSKYRQKSCQSCEKPLGHLVCVKGQLCSSCKSEAPSNASSSSPAPSGRPAPTSNGHVQKKDVAKPGTSLCPIVVCDCLICKAKADSPPLSAHTHSSPPPSLPTTCTSPPLNPPSLSSSLPTICSPPSLPSSSHSSTLPTSSSPTSPPSISPLSYTNTSAVPSLSDSQPTPPHPTSSLLPLSPPSVPPQSSHSPALPKTSTTSTVTPIPPPKRNFTPAEIYQIAASLPLVSTPGSPLSHLPSAPPLVHPAMVAEPPVSLSNLPQTPPTTSVSVAETTRVPSVQQAIFPPFLQHYPQHMLCSHIRTALLAAAAIASRPQLGHPSAPTSHPLLPRPATPGSVPSRPSNPPPPTSHTMQPSPTPRSAPRRILPNTHQQFYHHHRYQQQIQHLRNLVLLQQQQMQQQRMLSHPPRFNPVPTRLTALPTSLVSRGGKTSLISSSHKPRPALPSNLRSMGKKSQSLPSDLSICSYFDYVDDPSEIEYSLLQQTNKTFKKTSRTKGSSNALSQVDSTVSKGEESQRASASNASLHGVSSPTQAKVEEKVRSEGVKMRQKLKRKLSSYDVGVSRVAKKQCPSKDSETLVSLLTKKEAANSQEIQLVVHLALASISQEGRKRLNETQRAEKNNRFTAEFLKNKGLKAKTPRLVLHRVQY